MHTNRLSVLRLISRPLFLVAPAVLGVLAVTAPNASAQSPELLKKLNAPAVRVAEGSKSATRVFTAYLDLTKSPKPIGPEFNQTTIWPGMDGFAEVTKWAEANSVISKALLEVQNCQIFGVTYGTTGVDPKFVERGLIAEIGVGGDLTKLRFPYMRALESISAYVVAEMYRLCEAGSYDDAFKVGIAHLRVLRQACDGQMFEEKLAAMSLLSDAFSLHRDMLAIYGDKMAVESVRNLALKEYPFLRASENERLKRLALPEGDLAVADELIHSVFTSDGAVSDEKFAATFSGMQSVDQPLTSFGATKRWAKIAGVHGSLEASTLKLNAIYDDWWRRWRLPAYGPMISMPTVLSRTNPVKYAAVVLAVKDVDRLFEARRRLVAEYDGTVCSAGLVAYHREFNKWPDLILKAYTSDFPKRFNFDPYDKNYGPMEFESLGSKSRGIDTEYGRVTVTGCILYARNDDHTGNGASRHASGGKTDDFVLWPALRAISRGQVK